MKLVVILGAGASADFGVPTLRPLFREAYAVRYLAKNKWLAEHLQHIFWGPRGHTLNTSDKSLTVEEMLTLLRDWEKQSSIPKLFSTAELAKFRKSIFTLIYQALYFGKSSDGRFLNPLIEFADKQSDHTTWASFNWDCIFESSFWYCMGANPSVVVKLNGLYPGRRKHTYLKLHGSLNWWAIKNQLTYVMFGNSGSLAARWKAYDESDEITDMPVLLEPSYYKYQDELYTQLLPQWKFFLERLVDADYVLVIGYSLPSADSEARCKMLSAFQVNQKSCWGVIDSSKETIDRYERLFGTKRFRSFPSSLVAFNSNFYVNFKQLFPAFTPKPVAAVALPAPPVIPKTPGPGTKP